jgi:hypothetical protein
MDELDLLDWKRRIFELYAEVRRTADPEAAWRRWRDTRDELFASHPQSPLPESQRRTFTGLPYFDYDPTLRVLAPVSPRPREQKDVATSRGHPYSFTRFARVHVGDEPLDLYWLDGYGGGAYLCFMDETTGAETYGGGRYLLDTVKGSDLGGDGGRLLLDFNFSYNPSCSYDPRWVCPLAPPENRLAAAMRAGERVA